MDSLIVAKLGIRLGYRWIFRDLNFQLSQGQVGLVSGPNGCGKTTLLKILSGLLKPTQGDYRCLDQGQVLKPENQLARVGLLTPELRLYDTLSALENIVFFCRLRGSQMPASHWRQALQDLGVPADQQYGVLSTGQKQRVKLLWATWHQPALLLLDEPTANLDQAGIEWVAEFIQQYRQQHIVLLTSHRLEEREWADEHISLDRANSVDVAKGH